MIIIGIDPGISGAFAVYNHVTDEIISVYDMPLMGRLNGKGDEINYYELYKMMSIHHPDIINCEQVASMPKQGVASTFKFGESFGIIKGIIGAIGCRSYFIRPQVWKRPLGLVKKDKDVSRSLAITLCPEMTHELMRKKDCGRADAIHIARHKT